MRDEKSFSISKEQLLEIANFFSKEDGTCLLYSGGNYEATKRSFLCLFPVESFWIEESTVRHLIPGEENPRSYTVENPWDGLNAMISPLNQGGNPYPEWVGYLAFELGCFSDLEKMIPYHPSDIPDAYFLRPSVVITVDHSSGHGTLALNEESVPFLTLKQRKFLALLQNEQGRAELLSSTKKELAEHSLSVVKPLCNRLEYKKKVERAQELIKEGEIYQVNLSEDLVLKGDHCPFTIFREVVGQNPAPFMAFIRFPKFTIVSSSPERFLKKTGASLETRPIKGTMPRGKSPDEDVANKEALLTSAKERAELLMITDLMRNDLGRVSQTGTVVTEKIWHCEAYSNVFHLISIIRSKAKTGISPIEVLRSAFPGGSITGCPKLRALEVIQEFESRPRGIYTGSMGYFSGNGDFDFNIAIRTILSKDDLLKLQLGGAIVADSIPQNEYEEILHKGDSLFKSLRIMESD